MKFVVPQAGVSSMPWFAFILILFAGCWSLMLTAYGQAGLTYYGHDAAGNIVSINTSGSPAPSLFSHPRPQAAKPSGHAVFTVGAAGASPLFYQWQRDNVNIAGAVSEALLLTNVTATSLGNYRVVVSNSFGQVTSEAAVLDLDTDFDGMGDAWEIKFFGSTTAQNSLGDADGDGVMNLDEFLESTDPISTSSLFPRLFTSALGRGRIVRSPDLHRYALGQRVTVTAVPGAGATFFEWDGGLSGSVNPETITMSSSKTVVGYFLRPPNDNFADRILIEEFDSVVLGSNLAATKEAGEPNHAGKSGGRSVWWTWTSSQDGKVYLDTLGTAFDSSFDTLLAVYTGDSVGSLKEVASNDNFGGQGSQLSFDAVAGTTYQIAVDGVGGASGSITLSVRPQGVPLDIFAIFVGLPPFGNAPLTVTFSDFSIGDITNRFWNFGDGKTTNTTATTLTHTYGPGSFSATLTVKGPKGVSSFTNSVTALPTTQDPFVLWQLGFFGCDSCPAAAASADPDEDGMNNGNEFLAGTNPVEKASVLRITSVRPEGNNLVIEWSTAGGKTNALQVATPGPDGNFNNRFVDLTTAPHIVVQGAGDKSARFIDVDAAGSSRSRFYRVRLAP